MRIMIQASAGTGKSFLLTTICLWCRLHNLNMEACAPTGIAAANIEIGGTDITASTIHSFLGLHADMTSDLNLGKCSDGRVRNLWSMDVLAIDEVSMIDVGAWFAMKDQLATVAARF